MTKPISDTPIPGLTKGRRVHYVGQKINGELDHYVADIVKVWNVYDGLSNLKLIFDGTNDGDFMYYPETWMTSVQYDPTASRSHTWHYIEQA